MNELTISLEEPMKKIFFEVQQHKAMPFLEIAAVTGVRGDQLKESISFLLRENLIKLSNAEDMANSIVSVNGKYF